MLFFDSRFLLYEHRHELSEELPHDIHALLACLHIIESVPHGQKDRLHSSSVRCGVELRVTLSDVTDSNEIGSRLKGVNAFFEAFQS